MKISVIVLLSLITMTAVSGENDDGRAVFVGICMACHKVEIAPPMVAPPIFAVKHHYLRVYPERNDFVRQVKAWLLQPDASRSFMPGAMRRFNIMPPQVLEEKQAEAVAGFIYDTDFSEPEWYQQHFEAEHGVR